MMYLRVLFFLSVLIPCAVPAAPLSNAYAQHSEKSTSALLRKKMHAQLDFFKEVFEASYAPMEWKKQQFQWELDTALDESKNSINALETVTVKSYQKIARKLFHSARDYHVGIYFHSTEEAYLPFMVQGAKGRYFISYIDRRALPKKAYPFEVGDEVIAWNKQPIDAVIQKLKEEEIGVNVAGTDQALAELVLTMRHGISGGDVPKGAVALTVKERGTGQTRSLVLHWHYKEEKVRDFALLSMAPRQGYGAPVLDPGPKREELRERFFRKMMLHPLWMVQGITPPADNPHYIGARKSYIPYLGEVLWESPPRSAFHAYIFSTRDKQTVGYIRIPHYLGSDPEAAAFAELIDAFKEMTNALVVDQIDNPGGSIFYLYTLASLLTDHPVATPKHRIALTQEEVAFACMLLEELEHVGDDGTAQSVLGETMDGYPIDYSFAKLVKKFCTFLVNEWNQGHLITGPTHVFGVDLIHPHPLTYYDKPILFLINELDFSCADLMPALLQDGKRATLFGTRTAGAGGYVLYTEFSNNLGVAAFSHTGSMAERQDHRFLENLGVAPDISYELSARDLQEHYPEYREAILKALQRVMQS